LSEILHVVIVNHVKNGLVVEKKIDDINFINI